MTAQLTITMSHGFYLLIALSIPFLFLLRRNSISSTRLRYSFTSSPLFHFETLVVQLYSMATFQFDWNKQHSRGVKRIPATKNGCLIMGNSSGGICRREESINRRIGVTGLVCGNRVIFWINKHKSSVSAAGSFQRRVTRWPPTATRCRSHGGPVHGNIPPPGWPGGLNGGDNYVFSGHTRGGTRGTIYRSVVARATAIRHSRIIDTRVRCIMRVPTFNVARCPRLWLHCPIGDPNFWGNRKRGRACFLCVIEFFTRRSLTYAL